MKNLSLLLSPRVRGFRNAIIRSNSKARKRALIMTLLGLGFWTGMFVISAKVLAYFQSVEVIGDLLAHHLLSMVLLIFFSLLVFSHIITALSNLFLSNDLELCHATPSTLEEIFLSRSIFTVLDSSWMVVVFGFPVMMAYAYVYRPAPIYYIHLLHGGLALITVAAGLGILVTMILVNIFPAHRTRDIVMLLMIILLVALYLMFRFLRPERLVDPDAFFSVMQYLGALEAPDSPFLPTRWVAETLWDCLIDERGRGHVLNILLMWSTASALFVINLWVAQALYFRGFSKAQEAKRRLKGSHYFLDLFKALLTRPFGKDLGLIMDKEIRSFFRDNTQWSQLLLLGALVAVYLYNFSALPLDKSPIRLEFIQNEIAFLNMGLAGFVLSAVSVRFIYPTVSSEGEAFWIIRSSPVTMRRFLWGKYLFYLPPMILLAETLIIITNHLLEVTRFMMILCAVTMFFAVFGIVGLGIGFGSLYPRFRHENIAQVSTGFGGVMYMMVSTLFLALIIILEAGPVYTIFMANHRGMTITMAQWLFILPSFLAVIVITILGVYIPMKMGVQALQRLE